MKNKLRHYLLIIITAWSVVLFPSEALAYRLLSCDDSGNYADGELFFTDVDQAQSFCERSYQGLDRVFSQVACNFTTILNEVMSKMYCGMQYSLQPLIGIVLTMYIMFFGVQMLIGTVQPKISEVIIRLLKIAAVWMFVSSSTWAINYAFNFFLDLANRGVLWALLSITNSPFYITSYAFGGLTDVMPAYLYIDDLIKNVVTGPFMAANSELVVFFALMGYVSFPIFMLAIYWLITTFKILTRTLISFMLSIAALAFLITLSPIFMSFMLFQATRSFFESWLRFMISYALQIAIIFACVAMWTIAVTQFTGFFSELADVIFAYKKAPTNSATHIDPTESLGICPYRISYSSNGLPHVFCSSSRFNPDEHTNPRGAQAALADQRNLILLSNLNQSSEVPQNLQTALNALIYYLLYYLISLIIVCYAFDALLRSAPQIAIQLAGPEYVPILGQGYGYSGYGRIKGSSASTVRQAFTRNDGSGSNSFRDSGHQMGNAIQGVIERANQLVSRR